MLGSILGSPYLGKLPHGQSWTALAKSPVFSTLQSVEGGVVKLAWNATKPLTA